MSGYFTIDGDTLNFISNLTNFEISDFIDFMHNKGQGGKLINFELVINGKISMLTMFLGLCLILHIMCWLLSTL